MVIFHSYVSLPEGRYVLNEICVQRCLEQTKYHYRCNPRRIRGWGWSHPFSSGGWYVSLQIALPQSTKWVAWKFLYMGVSENRLNP